jgi:hypothetical protein
MPTTEDFGVVEVGASATKTLTLRNTGDEPSGVSMITITGADFAIPVGGNGCTAALGPNATCAIDVRFAPGAYDAKSGTLSATATPGSAAQSTLTGTGKNTFTLTVMKIGAGSVASGESSPAISCGATCS